MMPVWVVCGTLVLCGIPAVPKTKLFDAVPRSLVLGMNIYPTFLPTEGTIAVDNATFQVLFAGISP